MVLFGTLCIGLLALVPYASAQGDATKDLSSVLSSIKNLTAFHDLIKVNTLNPVSYINGQKTNSW